MAVRADEADSQIVTSVIIVKQRCAPPQFHPPSRIVHLPLDPAASAASPQRAAASSVEGNRREGRGGKKGRDGDGSVGEDRVGGDVLDAWIAGALQVFIYIHMHAIRRA